MFIEGRCFPPQKKKNSHPLLLFSEEGRGWGLTTVLKTGLTSLKLPMVSACDFHCSEVEISSAIIVNDLCGVKDRLHTISVCTSVQNFKHTLLLRLQVEIYWFYSRILITWKRHFDIKCSQQHGQICIGLHFPCCDLLGTWPLFITSYTLLHSLILCGWREGGGETETERERKTTLLCGQNSACKFTHTNTEAYARAHTHTHTHTQYNFVQIGTQSQGPQNCWWLYSQHLQSRDEETSARQTMIPSSATSKSASVKDREAKSWSGGLRGRMGRGWRIWINTSLHQLCLQATLLSRVARAHCSLVRARVCWGGGGDVIPLFQSPIGKSNGETSLCSARPQKVGENSTQRDILNILLSLKCGSLKCRYLIQRILYLNWK